MKYLVHTVGDDDLPAGVHRVIVEREDEPPLLIINGETAKCWRFMQAWEATCEPTWQPTVTIPALRVVV